LNKADFKQLNLQELQIFESIFVNDKISRADLNENILKIIAHGKGLADTLKDRENIGNVIGNIISFIYWFFVLFLILGFGIGVDTYNLLISFSTVLLATTFIFGPTISNAFQSFILIFLVRPFDIGDFVFLTGVYPDNVHVQTINLTNIIFRGLDGKIIIVPVTQLINTTIINFKRSESVSFDIAMDIPFNTPPTKLTKFKNQINQYLLHRPKVFSPHFTFYITALDEIGAKMSIKLTVKILKCSWQDSKNWWTARTDFYLFLQEIMTSLSKASEPKKIII